MKGPEVLFLRRLDLPLVRQLFVVKHGGIAAPSLVCPVLHKLRGNGVS